MHLFFNRLRELYSAGLIFVVCQSITKTAKIGPLENFPLYSSYWQECMMTSFLLWREEEERVTSYSGRGESRIFMCTMNGTFGWVVRVKAWVKVAAKQSNSGLMGWIKSLTERLCGLFWLSGMDSIVKQILSQILPVLTLSSSLLPKVRWVSIVCMPTTLMTFTKSSV